MNIVMRIASAGVLSLLASGTVQQAVMYGSNAHDAASALIPLAIVVLLITMVFGVVLWRQRAASAVDGTAASLLGAMLVFGMAASVVGVASLSPGVGGNIVYEIALLVIFAFLIPAAVAVPIHWLILRRARKFQV